MDGYRPDRLGKKPFAGEVPSAEGGRSFLVATGTTGEFGGVTVVCHWGASGRFFGCCLSSSRLGVGAGLGNFLWLWITRGGIFHAEGNPFIWLDLRPRRHRVSRGHDSQAIARHEGGALCHGIVFWRRAPGFWHLFARHREEQECGVNPEPFLQLDRVIHEKGRLAIMSLLAGAPELAFTELRDSLNMTDGNLTTHIRTLQEAGYVAVTKSFQNKRPLTTCSLTEKGREAFLSYISLLEQIVRITREK